MIDFDLTLKNARLEIGNGLRDNPLRVDFTSNEVFRIHDLVDPLRISYNEYFEDPLKSSCLSKILMEFALNTQDRVLREDIESSDPMFVEIFLGTKGFVFGLGQESAYDPKGIIGNGGYHENGLGFPLLRRMPQKIFFDNPHEARIMYVADYPLKVQMLGD